MLLLTNSTLFSINMMRSTPDSPNRKASVIAKVQHWTSRVQKECQQKTSSESPLGAPSISTGTDVPPSILTVVSKTTQSTGATSVLDNEDCEMAINKDEAYHGNFGEDGDDTLEREEALEATKEKPVSRARKRSLMFISSQLFAVTCHVDPSTTRAERRSGHPETKGL